MPAATERAADPAKRPFLRLRWPRPLRRFAGNSSGVAAIEFAILALPFFTLVFAIIETSLVFMSELTLDQGVDRVARMVRTGEIQKASMTAADFRNTLCSQVSFLLDCNKLQIDLKAYQKYSDIPVNAPVTTDPSGRRDLDTTGFGYTTGAPDTVMALRVYYKWPIYTDVMHEYLSDMSDNSHLLVGIAAFKTEPY